MIRERNVKKFFDEKAATWDNLSDASRPKSILEKFNHYFDNKDVLDIGCGTGILVNVLNKSNIDGIDISKKMIKIAKEKYPNINFECKSIYDYKPKKLYDSIIMYNVYPHFPDKEKLVDKVHSLLKPGGFFIVVHGDSKESINAHHKNHAIDVSTKLESAREESKIWANKFTINAISDNSSEYYFSGLAR